MRRDRRAALLVAASLVVTSGCASLSPAEVERFRRLESERDAGGAESNGGVLLCPIHKVQLQEGYSVTVGGFCATETAYMRARLTRFPYSFLARQSCSCDDPGGRRRPETFCPKCRDAERAWRRKHGYSIPDGAEAAIGRGCASQPSLVFDGPAEGWLVN